MSLRKILPKNLPLFLDDGRSVLVRKGRGSVVVCRQKGKGPPLVKGEQVATVPDKSGEKIVMKVIKRTRNDVTFEMLGKVSDV